MPLFDILGNDGLQRLGRLRDKKSFQKIQTPSIVLPVNDYLLSLDSYIDLIKQNVNVVPQIYEKDIRLPQSLEDRHIILQQGVDLSQVGSKSSKEEDFITYNGEKNDRVIQKISISCPSTPLNEEMSQILIKTLQDRLLSAFSSNGIDTDDIHIGLYWKFNEITSLESQIKSLINIVMWPEISSSLKIIDLNGLFENFMAFRDIIDAVISLKEKIPSDIILMASGDISLEYYPFLCYLGIDLIDACSLITKAFSDIYTREDDSVWIRELTSLDDISCVCTYCEQIRKILDVDVRQSISDRLNKVTELIGLHTAQKAISELKIIRRKVENGILRSYIESIAIRNTFLMSSLRYCDSLEENVLMLNQGLNKSNRLICATSLSYQEPQVRKFRTLIKNRIYPLSNTKVCIFLPCSMKKPYSTSKSHRRFLKSIRKGAKKHLNEVSQVIVTSPLGLVPRELEEVYPAAHYDISVTGEWDEEEKSIAADMILNWLNKLPEGCFIISHLYGGYLEAFNMAITQKSTDINWVFTRELSELESKLRMFFEQQDKSKRGLNFSYDQQKLRMLCDYQFGKGRGESFINNSIRIKRGRHYDYLAVYEYLNSKRELLGRIKKDSGHFYLSYYGASKLDVKNGNSIYLNTNQLRGSTIFQPALKKVDIGLCTGDEVIILDEDENFIGIGEMIVNSSTANNLRHGPIVDIRKKKKRDEN